MLDTVSMHSADMNSAPTDGSDSNTAQRRKSRALPATFSLYPPRPAIAFLKNCLCVKSREMEKGTNLRPTGPPHASEIERPLSEFGFGVRARGEFAIRIIGKRSSRSVGSRLQRSTRTLNSSRLLFVSLPAPSCLTEMVSQPDRQSYTLPQPSARPSSV